MNAQTLRSYLAKIAIKRAVTLEFMAGAEDYDDWLAAAHEAASDAPLSVPRGLSALLFEPAVNAILCDTQAFIDACLAWASSIPGWRPSEPFIGVHRHEGIAASLVEAREAYRLAVSQDEEDDALHAEAWLERLQALERDVAAGKAPPLLPAVASPPPDRGGGTQGSAFASRTKGSTMPSLETLLRRIERKNARLASGAPPRPSAFARWLDRLLEEKGIDTEHRFEVEGPTGLTNSIPIGCVVEHMKAASKQSQARFKTSLVRMDFLHQDMLPYFHGYASAIAK